MKAEEFEQFMASVGQQSTVGRQTEVEQASEGALAGKILCECSPLNCDEGELVSIHTSQFRETTD